MIPLRLEDLADVVGGELAFDTDADRVIDAVAIDSRTVEPGALFVPLPGEHVDGHDFLAKAVEAGATGYLVAGAHAEGLEDPAAALPLGGVVVDDPADALTGLGRWVRDTVDPVVVAITGSQGKTTTKDLVAVAVGAQPLDPAHRARRVVSAPGSYNNELGVPLTCCMLAQDSDVLVTEIGTRGLGHIAALTPVVRPTIAVVTAVGASHLELLGDVDTVAVAKAELVQGLDAGGVAVLNADDPRVAAMAAQAPGRVVTYGRSEDADWHARDVHLDRLARPAFTAHGPRTEPFEVRLGLVGEHNVGNALAALAVAAECGVDPRAAAAALASARVSRWRMELLERDDGLVVLNDAYNANPASTTAALRTLASLQVTGRRYAVLGMMGELGATSEDAHREIGRLTTQLGLDGVIVVGEGAEGISEGVGEAELAAGAFCTVVADADAAIADLGPLLRGDDAVLVKASRSVGLERVAEALAEQPAGAGAR